MVKSNLAAGHATASALSRDILNAGDATAVEMTATLANAEAVMVLERYRQGKIVVVVVAVV